MPKVATPGWKQNASTSPAPQRTGTADPQRILADLVRALECNRPPPALAPADSRPLLELESGGRIFRLSCLDRPEPPPSLSPRESEIARMIALGLPNKAIAGRLEISEWTVSTHLRRIFAKLGVSCRAAMVTHWLALQQEQSPPAREPSPRLHPHSAA